MAVGLDLQRQRDLGRILDDAFALYRRHWRTLLAASAAVVVPVELAVFGVGLGWLDSGYVATRPLGAALAGAAAQLLVITPLLSAVTVHVVLGAARGERPAAGAAIAAGLDAFSALFWPILMVALGVALGLPLVVPAVFLAVRWAVVAQVVVADGLRGGAALRRSMDLTAGRGWFSFLLLVVVNLVVALFSLVFTIPLELAARAADAQALSLLGQTLGQLLSLPLLTLAVTLLYFTLRARREGASAAPPGAPPPDRDPFGRRREEGWEPPVKDY